MTGGKPHAYNGRDSNCTLAPGRGGGGGQALGSSQELGLLSSRIWTWSWVWSWHVAWPLVGIKGQWVSSAAGLLEGQRHRRTLLPQVSKLPTLHLPSNDD